MHTMKDSFKFLFIFHQILKVWLLGSVHYQVEVYHSVSNALLLFLYLICRTSTQNKKTSTSNNKSHKLILWFGAFSIIYIGVSLFNYSSDFDSNLFVFTHFREAVSFFPSTFDLTSTYQSLLIHIGNSIFVFLCVKICDPSDCLFSGASSRLNGYKKFCEVLIYSLILSAISVVLIGAIQYVTGINIVLNLH